MALDSHIAERKPVRAHGGRKSVVYSSCSISLPRTAKRRILSSASTKHFISVFKEIIDRRYPGVSQTLATEGSLLCILCFRRLEGILKLRHQLSEKEKIVEDSLDHGTLMEFSAKHLLPEACTPPRKQARIEGIRGSTPRRRRRIDTPTRHAIQRLQPAASPIVAVSDSCSWCLELQVYLTIPMLCRWWRRDVYRVAPRIRCLPSS